MSIWKYLRKRVVSCYFWLPLHVWKYARRRVVSCCCWLPLHVFSRVHTHLYMYVKMCMVMNLYSYMYVKIRVKINVYWYIYMEIRAEAIKSGRSLREYGWDNYYRSLLQKSPINYRSLLQKYEWVASLRYNCVCMSHVTHHAQYMLGSRDNHGVAATSRLLQIIGLFCKRDL